MLGRGRSSDDILIARLSISGATGALHPPRRMQSNEKASSARAITPRLTPLKMRR